MYSPKVTGARATPAAALAAAAKTIRWTAMKTRALMFRAAAALGALLLAAKGADLLLSLERFDPAAPAARAPGLLTFEPYPYDGWHLPARYEHRGDFPREGKSYHDYTIRTGQMGFMTDFDLLSPPRKAKGEVRVLLTGGSAAQGLGARDNAAMLDRRLETRLSALLGPGRRAIVIDLAMAGSTAYQNFIALDRWGSSLEPDLIVAYIGANDCAIPFETGSDAPYQFPEVAALVAASRGTDAGPLESALRAVFPSLLGKTRLGPALGLLLSGRGGAERARRRYEEQRGVAWSTMPPERLLSEVAVGQTVAALRSIKRDFAGVPVAVVWQPVGAAWEAGLVARRGLPAGFYARAFAAVKAGLDGYRDGRWLFLDADAALAKEPGFEAAVHLDDAGQDKVAALLAPRLLPLLPKR